MAQVAEWSELLPVTETKKEKDKPPREPPEIRIGEDGHVHGIDGMLDQIAGTLTRHAVPAIARDVLPIVQKDRDMQHRIGTAIGASIAERTTPWIMLGVGALAVIAYVQLSGSWHPRRRRE